MPRMCLNVAKYDLFYYEIKSIDTRTRGKVSSTKVPLHMTMKPTVCSFPLPQTVSLIPIVVVVVSNPKHGNYRTSVHGVSLGKFLIVSVFTIPNYMSNLESLI
jgi:hypothetical protein